MRRKVSRGLLLVRSVVAMVLVLVVVASGARRATDEAAAQLLVAQVVALPRTRTWRRFALMLLVSRTLRGQNQVLFACIVVVVVAYSQIAHCFGCASRVGSIKNVRRTDDGEIKRAVKSEILRAEKALSQRVLED